MARSRIFKSLTFRLLLVSAIVALGVYAIMQMPRANPEGTAAEKQPSPEVKTASRSKQISLLETAPGPDDGYAALPAPETTMVRGQNEEEATPPAVENPPSAENASSRYAPPSYDDAKPPTAPGYSRYGTPANGDSAGAITPPPSLPPSGSSRYGDVGDRYAPAAYATSPATSPATDSAAPVDPTASRYGDAAVAAEPAATTPIPPSASADVPSASPSPATVNPLRAAAANENQPAPREPYTAPSSGAPPATNLPPAGAAASLATSDVGAGIPGPVALEGPQTPTLVIEKSAPAEIQVGKPATFLIKVRNVGRVAAQQVIVQDEIPEGVRFVDALPKPTVTDAGLVLWQLGALEPGDETVISMQLVSLNEGEIGSVATVSFQAQASVRTRSTKPELQIEQSAPTKVLIGDPVTVGIRISNPGSGSTTKIVLEEDVPEGLAHTAGRQIEYEIGILRPGEVRELELILQAAKAGVVENLLIARGEGNLVVESRAKIEVVAPQLELAISGPTRRYLNRQATYTIGVTNPGTAAAKNIELIARLPRGFKFVDANNEGQYEPKAHAVYWSLDQLPEGENGQVQVSVIPNETGAQKLQVDSRAALGLTASHEHVVAVEGLAELVFTVADLADPIEVGKDTLYEITVTNTGSKTAENIVFSASLPPQMKPLGAEGPTRWDINGQQLLFQPVARLNPNEKLTFTVQAQGLAEGDQRVRFQLESAQNRAPIIKEESTIVYSEE